MALLMLLIFAVISLALVPGHVAQSPAEIYWKTKLGNIPMPRVVKDSLQPAGSDVGDANARLSYAVQELLTTSMNNKNNIVNEASIYPQGLPTNARINDNNNRVNKDSIYPQGLPTSARMNNKNNRVNDLTMHPQGLEGATTMDNKNTRVPMLDSVIFFSEKDLTHPEGKMKLHLATNDDDTKFLPSKVAQLIPFSIEKQEEILNLFSIKPNSVNAKIMEETIKMCEEKVVNGEDKHCTTSLEDMVDYAITKIGDHIKVYSTEIDKDTLMEYRVEEARKISNGVNVVCHKLSYPYAVFYCHSLKTTNTYVVSLVGTDGKKTKAIAVCHKDPSSWNPRQLLEVKPKSMSKCHFLNEITIVWVPY